VKYSENSPAALGATEITSTLASASTCNDEVLRPSLLRLFILSTTREHKNDGPDQKLPSAWHFRRRVKILGLPVVSPRDQRAGSHKLSGGKKLLSRKRLTAAETSSVQKLASVPRASYLLTGTVLSNSQRKKLENSEISWAKKAWKLTSSAPVWRRFFNLTSPTSRSDAQLLKDLLRILANGGDKATPVKP
jgi:hypothetical protein